MTVLSPFEKIKYLKIYHPSTGAVPQTELREIPVRNFYSFILQAVRGQNRLRGVYIDAFREFCDFKRESIRLIKTLPTNI